MSYDKTRGQDKKIRRSILERKIKGVKIITGFYLK
jgi:hypothetical protein